MESPSISPTMSFPAILRNPGLAHLLHTHPLNTARSRKDEGSRVRETEGKRRIRRRENAKFASNPHVVAPSPKDYAITPVAPKRTFSEPLPMYLRNDSTPARPTPMLDHASSAAGQFTLSLRGLRKELRHSGPGTMRLVKDVENELLSWLETGDVLVFPTAGVVRECDAAPGSASFTGSGPIREVERTPMRLVWSTEDDAFARYIIHCVCRWHSVVSYSKAQDHVGSLPRLTYILRSNPSRFTANANNPLSALETPPTTVLDTASSRGGAFDSQDSASEMETLYTADFEDDASEVGSLVNSVPDMRESSIIPPITQQSFTQQMQAHDPSPAPSLAVPSSALQNLSLHQTDEEDAAEGTPRARAPRRVTRTIARLASSRSRSRSSPSRSPSVRWRVPLPSISIPGATNSLPLRHRMLNRRPPTSSTRARTLWSFVYE